MHFISTNPARLSYRDPKCKPQTLPKHKKNKKEACMIVRAISKTKTNPQFRGCDHFAFQCQFSNPFSLNAVFDEVTRPFVIASFVALAFPPFSVVERPSLHRRHRVRTACDVPWVLRLRGRNRRMCLLDIDREYH